MIFKKAGGPQRTKAPRKTWSLPFLLVFVPSMKSVLSTPFQGCYCSRSRDWLNLLSELPCSVLRHSAWAQSTMRRRPFFVASFKPKTRTELSSSNPRSRVPARLPEITWSPLRPHASASNRSPDSKHGRPAASPSSESITAWRQPQWRSSFANDSSALARKPHASTGCGAGPAS